MVTRVTVLTTVAIVAGVSAVPGATGSEASQRASERVGIHDVADEVRTVHTIRQGEPFHFAVDDGRVAWVRSVPPSAAGRFSVEILDLRRRKRTVIARIPEQIPRTTYDNVQALALGGSDVAVNVVECDYRACGTSVLWRASTGSGGFRAVGSALTPLAGGGGMIVYSNVRGELRRIANGRDERITTAGWVDHLAAAHGLVAIAKPRSLYTTYVSILRAGDGKLLRRFLVAGEFFHLAISPSFVAMLVRHDGRLVIKVHDADTGAHRVTVPIGRDAGGPDVLTISGSRVLFSLSEPNGAAIRQLDVKTGRQSTVVPLRRRLGWLFGPWVSGRDLLWAERRTNSVAVSIRALKLG